MVQLIFYCKVYTLTLEQDPKGTPSGLPLFLLFIVSLNLVRIRDPNYITFKSSIFIHSFAHLFLDRQCVNL